MAMNKYQPARNSWRDMIDLDINQSAGELGTGNPGSYGGANTANSMYDAGAMDLTQQGQGGFDWGGTAKGFGSVAQGIGGLAQAWQGIQGLKLAKKQLKTQNEQWEKNYQAQRSDIANDRARMARSRSLMYS